MTANDVVTAAVERELEKRGMNRADLSRLVGHARSWATRRLTGERRWSVDDLDVLARGLGVPLESLVRTTHRSLRGFFELPVGSSPLRRARAA